MSVLLYSSNINCSGCVASVAPVLDAFDGIESWSVNTDDPQKILSVQGDFNEPALMAALKELGYKISRIEK